MRSFKRGSSTRRRIFPDEEGTERLPRGWQPAGAVAVAESSPMRRGLKAFALAVAAGVASSRRIFPDEEGTERKKYSQDPANAICRRIFPDEEGTESHTPPPRRARGAPVAESSPMRRGLKVGLAIGRRTCDA